MDVFLEREFEVDGIEGAAKLRIGKPQPKDQRTWYCKFQVIGIGDEKVRKVYGVDSVQALLGAIQAVKGLLEGYEKRDYKITWLGGNDLGLDVTKSAPD